MQGMINQENESEGFIRICFECEKSELEKICSMYRKYRKNIMKIKVKRVDTKGRKLQCQTIFPEEEKIPFVRTPFENNYKIGKSGVNHHFIKINNLVKRHKERSEDNGSKTCS